jgi:hypothetical protein
MWQTLYVLNMRTGIIIIYLEFFVIYFCQCYFTFPEDKHCELIYSAQFLVLDRYLCFHGWKKTTCLIGQLGICCLWPTVGERCFSVTTYWNHHCYVTKIICFRHTYWNHHCYVTKITCFKHTYWNKTYNLCYITMMIPVRMFKTCTLCYITMMIPIRMLKTCNLCYITMMIPIRMFKTSYVLESSLLCSTNCMF